MDLPRSISIYIHYLDVHSGAISAIATVLLTIFTFAYAFLTYKLVRQNIYLHEEATKPILSLRAVLDDNFFQIFNLRIQNVGAGLARDIRIEVTNPPHPESSTI